MQLALNDKRFYIINGIVSVAAVLFLFWLIYLQEPPTRAAADGSILPALIATFNGMCAICLAAGLVAIKRRAWIAHRNIMFAAFGFSALFLVFYVLYHSLHGSTTFEGQGAIRYVYFFILITHVVLSIINLPLILTTFYFSLTKQFTRHRKLAKFVWPSWMYVSVTGVLVYLFLRHFNV